MNQNSYKFLLCILLIAHNSFASQYLETFLENTGKGVVLGMGVCAASVMLELYIRSGTEKVSSTFETWAKEQLTTSGENKKTINVIDFRSDKSWMALHVCMNVNKDDEKIIEQIASKAVLSEDENKSSALIRHRLFHEYKHIYNCDRLKHNALLSMAAAPMCNATTFGSYIFRGLVVGCFSVFYSRYQEIEADRFAFKKMDSNDIKRVQTYMRNEAEKYKNSFQNKISLYPIRSFFGKAVYFLYLKIFSNASQTQKDRMWHKIAYFFLDSFQYPDWYTRSELAEESSNKN